MIIFGLQVHFEELNMGQASSPSYTQPPHSSNPVAFVLQIEGENPNSRSNKLVSCLVVVDRQQEDQEQKMMMTNGCSSHFNTTNIV